MGTWGYTPLIYHLLNVFGEICSSASSTDGCLSYGVFARMIFTSHVCLFKFIPSCWKKRFFEIKAIGVGIGGCTGLPGVEI